MLFSRCGCLCGFARRCRGLPLITDSPVGKAAGPDGQGPRTGVSFIGPLSRQFSEEQDNLRAVMAVPPETAACRPAQRPRLAADLALVIFSTPPKEPAQMQPGGRYVPSLLCAFIGSYVCRVDDICAVTPLQALALRLSRSEPYLTPPRIASQRSLSVPGGEELSPGRVAGQLNTAHYCRVGRPFCHCVARSAEPPLL